MFHMEHREVQRRHERLYRSTVHRTLDGIHEGKFSEGMEGRILNGLRRELGQCIEFLLISPEFYGEQMELIDKEMYSAMQT